MDGLRWLLLLFGLLVIAGVYFYSRREKRAPKTEAPASGRREPTLGADESPADPGEDPVPGDAEPIDVGVEEDAPATPEKIPQKIVTLRLVARDGGSFRGDEMALSLRGIGMRHGKFGIFHRYDGNNEESTVFSAASLIEPGSFDMTNIKEQELPGISLFLILPGPLEGAEAFDMMMEAARAVAQALDGELLDESGSTLSIQRERYMREEIIQFEHSIKVA
jgi:cell division protein ZipA